MGTPPILTRPRAFLGISFDESDKSVKEWFETLLRACGFDVVTAEESEHLTLGDKVRRKIESCDVTCFVLTPQFKVEGSDEWLPPQWIHGEIGIAYESRRRLAGFAERGVCVAGLLSHIEDYTRFSRENLNRDAHPILASLLSLRLPGVQDAIQTLLEQRKLEPILLLAALRASIFLVSKVRRLKDENPDCPVVSLIRDEPPLLILGRGSKHGIFEGSTWLVTRPQGPPEHGIEEKVGRVRITYTQPKMAHAVFGDPSEENKMRDKLRLELGNTNEKVLPLHGWKASAEDLGFLQHVDITTIDRFIKLIDDLLSGLIPR